MIESVISQIKPTTHSNRGGYSESAQRISDIVYVDESRKIKINKSSYFTRKNCPIAYFKENSKSYFKIDLECP